ncbi:SCO family protein [Thiohalobacter sp. IOR34]|uniref:SCO family protein n=1 Tax=Thiohalobacter sp. IOR34 TaxID=3057176 RepID=UPI0025B21B9B|nr:SCO family protein [Thiohalobacter sp. IOR34]WJW74528.1 SCO family protein [Thiohalobacter sp. IOR34]
MQPLPHKPRGEIRIPTLLSLAALIAVLYVAFEARSPAPLPETGPGTRWLEEPRSLQPFSLVRHDETPFTSASLKGHWTLLVFGQSHCQAICPTTLGTLNQVLQAILRGGERAPEVVFASLDPEQDTPRQLTLFLAYFNPAFVGVSGKTAEIEAFARQFGIEPGRSEAAHSAGIQLIDPQGRLTAVFLPPFDAALIARDFLRLSHYLGRGRQAPPARPESPSLP